MIFICHVYYNVKWYNNYLTDNNIPYIKYLGIIISYNNIYIYISYNNISTYANTVYAICFWKKLYLTILLLYYFIVLIEK